MKPTFNRQEDRKSVLMATWPTTRCATS